MTNQQVMQLMTDLGLHEGGLENWVYDNAWVQVVNKALELERERFCSLLRQVHDSISLESNPTIRARPIV